MRFSDLLDAARSNPLDVTIPAEWAQGRATFGGLVAALQYEALRAQVPADRPLRSLAITFVGPVAPDVPASYQVEVLREGKAVSQLLGRVVQNGEVATLVQASFGASRPSEIDVASEPPPVFKHWDECQELPYIKGVTPEFMRHLAMRWSVGGLPFTGNKSRDMGGWVRLRGCERGATDRGAYPRPGRRLATGVAATPEKARAGQRPDLDHRVHPAVARPDYARLVPVPRQHRTRPRRLWPRGRCVVEPDRRVDRPQPPDRGGVRLNPPVSGGAAAARRATSHR